MFTQNLDCVRLWDQERFDYTIPKKTNSKEERKDTDKLSDGYDPTQTDNGVPTTVDADNVAQTASTKQLANEVAAGSLPEQDVADLGEFENDLASRREFQDLQNAFPDTGPFDGIPADGSVLDQQNGVNNLFGQNR